AVVRLYRFETFLEFLDDQGRDAIVIKRILINHDLTLLGPGTSVGKMYLGPLYYYLMVPFLAMTYPEPTGPGYAIALLSVVTVWLVYALGKKIVGEKAALFATALYATSPWIVKLSRFSWQPNPAPFVALLMMYLSVQAIHKKKIWYWFWVACCLTVLSQLHYVALLSAIPTGMLFLYDLYRHGKGKLKTYGFVVASSLVVFLLSLSPLIAFDRLHNGLISSGFREYLQDQTRKTTLAQRLEHAVEDIHGRSMFVTVEMLGLSKEQRAINTYIVLAFFIVSVAALMHAKKSQHALGVGVVALWVGMAVVGLTLFRDTIYPHYVAFLFPAVTLLFGVVAAYLSEKHVLLHIGSWLLVVWLIVVNLSGMYFWTATPFGINDLRSVSKSLLVELKPGERYNIALLNDNREYRGMKYRYFLDVTDRPPASEYDYNDLDKLVVIVENGENPKKAPIFEIQRFFEQYPHATLLTELSYKGIVTTYIFGR
ncbi:MAG TPA: glycosyltransferase family 39 protein, partial [Patescibacteria group bacterium]|nr:glycosyltransferase family 39 protein [Patescibacteria group bacterium]